MDLVSEAGAVNAHRGEVGLVVDGQTRTLCLTLGALAEIESYFGAGHLAELDRCLAHPGTRDLIAILGALLRGGGNDMSDEAVAASVIDLPEATAAISRAFGLAGFGARPAGGETP